MKFTDFGGVVIASAIDEFTISVTGASKEIDPRELRNGLGMAQVDCWPEGRVEKRKIDGSPVFIRRSGWRIEVWGADDVAPEPRPLPAPPGASDPNRVQSSRVVVAEGYLETPLKMPGFDLRGITRDDAKVTPAAPAPAPTVAPIPADSLSSAMAALGRAMAAKATRALRQAEQSLTKLG